ncbi:hypothetical protein VAT7223_01308 [Vibrio atlanticus]|uniref:Uncharacterized protein n=1 Tax=Vibrio atlanticus TaxID=693153 RepID=A0A1C3IN66_9VIBR|nr:hypothetical protein VAT7223_01308 [Vibrio atlanticus]
MPCSLGRHRSPFSKVNESNSVTVLNYMFDITVAWNSEIESMLS